MSNTPRLGGPAVYPRLSARWRREWRGWRAFLEGLLYLSPSLAIFGLFVFYPLVKSVRLSLFQTDPFGVEKAWVGLQHYVDLFRFGGFGDSLITTALFALYTVVPGILLALVLAVMASWRLSGITFFRTVFASPVVVAVASASLIFAMLYSPMSGVFNYLLSLFHVERVNWLTDPRWALPAVALVAVWRSLGFNTIVLLSGLQAIPEELHESSRIDGAGPWRSFWNISLPLLSPSLSFLAIVSVINALQAFGEINILTQGGPAGATKVIVYSLYREAFFNFNFSFATAQAVVLFLIILALTVLQFRFFEGRVFYQ